MRQRVCAGNRCCVRHINQSADVIKEYTNGFHEIADKVHHSCKADPAPANGCADGCMGAPSSSATARQVVMRSADVCDSRALRQVLSAGRCEGPADAAPQGDEPQPETPCPPLAGVKQRMFSTQILDALRTCRLRQALPPRDRPARLLAWKAACVAAWQGLPVQHSPRHATVQHCVSLA
jgi:hypothetical protein